MTDIDPDDELVAEEEKEAAAEAAAIGGRATDEPTESEEEMDPAQRAVAEGGGGESEGFELAEAELEEHASHGDEHAAGRVLQDAALLDEGDDAIEIDAEADEEVPPDR